MPSFIDILHKEQALGEILLRNTDANTCGMISNTCNMFNEVVKDDMHKHFIEYTKTKIPESFEEIATNKMFAYFKNPNNTKEYKSVEEYDKELEELAKQINKENYDAILDKMKEKYMDYTFENNISRGTEQIMYSYMEQEYKNFLQNNLYVDINDDDVEEYNSDDEFYEHYDDNNDF